MRANGLELRQRIIAALAAGHDKDTVSVLFKVDRSTINRHLRRAAADDPAPKTSPGRPRHIGPADEEALERQVRLHPTDTLAKHCQRLEATTSEHVSVASMPHAISRPDWTRKKQPDRPGTRRGCPGGLVGRDPKPATACLGLRR